jgi:phosphoglycerate kinase
LDKLKDSCVILLAHQGRPGNSDFYNLESHADILSSLLRKKVKYIDDIFGSRAQDAIKSLEKGEVLLLENTRFYAEENIERPPSRHAKNTMVKKLAPLCDYFINDAFAVSHRSQISVVGFNLTIKSAAGLLLDDEMEKLNKVFECNHNSCILFIGGTKIKDSVKLINYLLKVDKIDKILLGWRVAIFFLIASGVNVGKCNKRFLDEYLKRPSSNKQFVEESYMEDTDYLSLLPVARKLLDKYPEKIVTPYDFAVNKNGNRLNFDVDKLPEDYPIVDIGKNTIKKYSGMLEGAEMAIVNGAAGDFQNRRFSEGTKKILESASRAKFSIAGAGGGYSAHAVELFGVDSRIDHVTTGGAASLAYLSGHALPGIQALIKSKKKFP